MRTLPILSADRPAALCVLLEEEEEEVLAEGLLEEGCQGVLVGILVGRIPCGPMEDKEFNLVTQHTEDTNRPYSLFTGIIK